MSSKRLLDENRFPGADWDCSGNLDSNLVWKVPKIAWLTNLADALAESLTERKPVLLEFIKDNCSGCAKMEHTVFGEATIHAAIESGFIPLRQNIISDRAVRSQYGAIWTPSFYFLNGDGKLLWFSEGAMETSDFRTLMIIGQVRYLLQKGRYAEVIDILESYIAAHPEDVKAAQLIFLNGMAYYLKYGDKDAFHAAMCEIIEKYPHSPEARMWPWEGQFPHP